MTDQKKMPRKRSFSLAFQYAATISILIAISMGLLGALLLYTQSQQNQKHINQFGQIIVKQLSASAVEPLFTDQTFELEVLINNFSFEKQIISAAIFSVDKKLIASKGQLPQMHEIDFDQPYTQLNNTARFNYTEPQMVVHIHPITFKGVNAGYSLVVFENDSLNEQFKQQLILIIVASVFLFLLLMVASIVLGKKLSRPITEIVSAASALQSGKKIAEPKERRNDELGLLMNAINNMGDDLVQKDQLEGLLGKFLAKDVADKVIHQLDSVQLAGEHVHATVLFADIVGFTSISEKMDPAEVQKLLNEYYGYFTSCARFYFGSVDKFIGDCVMVVFGAPKDDPKHQYHSISCALLMQELAKRLNERRKKAGMFPIELRIGINSGSMLAGFVGSEQRMEYTVVGDSVNLASRLCSEAEGSETIIEQSLYDHVNKEYPLTISNPKEIRVRGKETPVNIYSVQDIKHSHPVVMEDLIGDILNNQEQPSS